MASSMIYATPFSNAMKAGEAGEADAGKSSAAVSSSKNVILVFLIG
jgi:hypothetical protein